MNTKKAVDYSSFYSALDSIMQLALPQLELYWQIGKTICAQNEKGAAVSAAEYLQSAYPDAAGFSPRNVRRMRDFYRTYENDPALMAKAIKLGWTQNIVVLECCETKEQPSFYIELATKQHLTKLELVAAIREQAHSNPSLDEAAPVCYNENDKTDSENNKNDKNTFYLPRQYLPQPDGGIYNERYGAESWAGRKIRDCLCRYQPGGNRQPGISTCKEKAGGAWNLLRGTLGPTAYQRRLRPIRSADWHGHREPAEYVQNLRRRLCWEAASAAGLYRPSPRCSGPVVYP